jgi:succinoglycan biosynthesis transport protein ExoP
MVEKQSPEDSRASRMADVRAIRSSPADSRPDIREAFGVVWLRKWSILAITLLVVAVALFLSSRQPPVYEASAKVLVTPPQGTGTSTTPPQEPNLPTEAELVNSAAVAEIAAKKLGYDGAPRTLLDSLSVDQPTDTDIINIAYRNPDAPEARRRAAAFAAAYLEFRTKTATDAIAESARGIREQIQSLTNQYNDLNRKLQALSANNPNRSLLETQANFLSTQILQLQQELVALPDNVTVGQVVEPAALPTSPVSPNHVVNAGFGLVVGLAAGIGIAFLRERLSDRIRSPEEAEAYLEGPILGVVPRVPTWRRRKKPLLVTATQWRSPAAESYRVLRTNILAAASSLDVKSIAVTSAHAGEGKSVTVANLGVVLAKAGKRVSLVSADLRRPRLHEFFERQGEPGLIEVITGQVALADVLQRVTLPTRGFNSPPAELRLLPSGRVPEDPTDLVTSDMVGKVIKALEEVSDIVLIDVPPVLPVTDALVVAAITENVIFVIGPKSDTRTAITSARYQIDRVGARIIGGVLSGPEAALVQTYYSY